MLGISREMIFQEGEDRNMIIIYQKFISLGIAER